MQGSTYTAVCDSLDDRLHFSSVHCVPGVALTAMWVLSYPALTTGCSRIINSVTEKGPEVLEVLHVAGGHTGVVCCI